MKQRPILKYTISSFFALFSLFLTGQTNIQKDSIVYKKNYGLRIGIDLSKPIISLSNKNFKGYELTGDYRIKKNLYLATELGYVDKTSQEDNFNYSTEGPYITVGININAFKNWLEMDNELYYGARYGFSTFSQTLNNYTIFQNGTHTNNLSAAYFEPRTVQANTNYNNLNAHWLAFVIGIKAETFKNLYLGLNISFNKLIHTTEPTNFKNLYIPGFNKVYATNSGVSFNYCISYRIPLYKK